MDETNGLRLIEKLKEDQGKFREEGGAYQLLQEYFDGLSKETLRDLLCCEDKSIRQTALWIISELGEDSKALLEEVACIAADKYMDDFMRVFGFFEHSNAKIRTLSMFIISRLSDSRIQEAYSYSVNNKILSSSHEKGLVSLMNVNTLTASDITAMIDSDDFIIRKYGVIAASRVYEKYPEIMKKSVNSEDSDVRDFSKDEVQAKAEIAQLFHRIQKH